MQINAYLYINTKFKNIYFKINYLQIKQIQKKPIYHFLFK